ncbi:MAG: hypothetical protein RIM99_13025 [Cyclobacteriaceae bacterium]
MKIKLIATVILLSSVFSVFAQKIKYKDLFPILDSKNWTTGGPQLRTFLSDPKNSEEANAHLQMGMMLEDQFFKLDATNDSSRFFNCGDSAVFFFNRAKELITDKEVKKNDQYYQSFFRRDLRTGDFGIKASDVNLDIEKKVESIESKMASARELNQKVKSTDDGNRRDEEKYKGLVNQYKTYNELLIKADAKAITTIQDLKNSAFETKKIAEDVKGIASALGTGKYSGEIQLMTIVKYGEDGMTSPDLSDGIVKVWDYDAWASNAISEINGPIAMLKSMTVSYSKSIREKKSLVKKNQDAEPDSLSGELAELYNNYDPESVAKKLLLTEASEVRIMRLSNFSINKALLDSSLVGEQLATFEAILKEAEKMHLVLSSINQEDIDIAKSTYKDYIDSFFQPYTTAGSYVTNMKTWSAQQKKWASDAVEYWTERSKWGIVTVEGEESKKIPLFVQDTPETEFFTLGMPLNTNDEVIVFGANMSEKKGYIYSFDQGRYTNWGLEFNLPGDGNYQLSADTIPAGDGATGLYLLNATVQENNLALASFTTTGTLNWSTVITVPKAPVDFKFDDLTQELTILLYPEEDLPLDNGEVGYLVIDRTGNAR